MRLELHPDAEAELLEAASWYDDRGPGLGEDLLGEVERWLEVLREAPLTWPLWPGAPRLDPPVRRVLTSGFPFAIAYQASRERVTVLAVAHTSRRPFYWTSRSS